MNDYFNHLNIVNRKKIILSAVVMLSSLAGYAQHEVGTLSLKPQVGMTISSLTNAHADAKVGLAAGAEFEYQATDIFSITAGAFYSMQGAKWSGISVDLPFVGKVKTGDVKLNLSYINVPILANVYVLKGMAVKLGVQPGFCVDKDNSIAKTVDLAIPVGLSYEYNNFVLDGRYNFGVADAFKSGDAKNSVFQITLGYKFDL